MIDTLVSHGWPIWGFLILVFIYEVWAVKTLHLTISELTWLTHRRLKQRYPRYGKYLLPGIVIGGLVILVWHLFFGLWAPEWTH